MEFLLLIVAVVAGVAGIVALADRAGGSIADSSSPSNKKRAVKKGWTTMISFWGTSRKRDNRD